MADISEDNFIGTDDDGTSYYVDDSGSITAVAADGTTTTNDSGGPSGDPSTWEDEGGYTYDTDTDTDFTFDSNGNLINADTGEAATATVGGKTGSDAVIGVMDGNGKTVSGYNYNEATGKYENANGRSFTDAQLDQILHNAYGGDAGAKYASNIANVYGNALNNGITNAVKEGGETVRQAIANAADGDPASQVLIAAVTGTVPTNITDGRVYSSLQDMQDRLAKGEDLKTAFYGACDKSGLTANAKMNEMLIEAAINIAGMGLSGLGAGIAGVGGLRARHAWPILSSTRNALNALKVGGRYAGVRGAVALNGANKFLKDVGNTAKGVGYIIQGLMALGMAKEDAEALAKAAQEDASKTASPYEVPNSASVDIMNKKEEEADSTPAAAAKTTTAAPTATKAAAATPTAKTAPTATSETSGHDVTFPSSAISDTSKITLNTGIDWVEVAKGTEKPGEKAKYEGYEEDSSDDSDSGSDNLESSSQDAPSSGVGTDTFINTNDDTKKEWGLGEEDPNRANYDNDKWNRGMENVSTNVVSDAKCKNFISKTFKDDPVLIKTVQIMKNI